MTVRTYEVRSDAEIARARLAADGIRSAVRADDEGGLNPGFYRDYGVRLEVAEADLDDARESLGIERVTVPREIGRAMAASAMAMAPDEACGLLLADADGELVMVCCLTNADASPSRFTILPREHFGALRYAESRGWSIAGVFHSHVRSEPYPSGSDLSGGGDPDWLHLIIGPVYGRNPELRAFRYEAGRATEVSVFVAP